MLLAIVVFSSFSAIIGAISEGEAITRGDIPMLFIVIGSVIAGIVVLVALVAVYQVISYKHLYYELGPEEFNLYSGILNKKRVHVPYQRIQSVDQHATLIQRIFGVCSVSIDTAGGAANKAVIVPYVQKTQAEELRRELFARKQYAVAVQNGAAPDAAVAAMASAAGVPAQALHEGANVLDAPAEIWQDVRGVFGGAAVDTGRVTYEYGMSNKELVFTGLSNNTAFFVVVVGIVGAVAQFMSEMAPILSRFDGAARWQRRGRERPAVRRQPHRGGRGGLRRRVARVVVAVCHRRLRLVRRLPRMSPRQPHRG